MADIVGQFREENEHVRHVMKLLVSWYTFFITTNIAAVSWLSTATTVQPDYPGIKYGIAWFFFANTLLGIFALIFIDRYFIKANNRVLAIVALYNGGYAVDRLQYKDKSPVPITFYRLTGWLFFLSLIIVLLFWYYFFLS